MTIKEARNGVPYIYSDVYYMYIIREDDTYCRGAFKVKYVEKYDDGRFSQIYTAHLVDGDRIDPIIDTIK